MFSQSPETAKRPVGKKELPVGSSNILTGLSFGSFNGESGSQLEYSNGPTSSKLSDICKDNQSRSIETADNILTGTGGKLKENGSIHNSSRYLPLSNGNKEMKMTDGIDLTSLSISENKVGPPEEFPSLALRHNGVSLKEESINGTINEKIQNDNQKASNGPLTTIGDLLPRGLINSGNLCFLNATLQALLSCSQLVKLLQELRSRSISKVCFCIVFRLLFHVYVWILRSYCG